MLFKESSIRVHDNYTLFYKKPNKCPVCGIAIDAAASVNSSGNNIYVIFFKCTVDTCQSQFFGVYKKLESENHHLPSELLFSYPDECADNINSDIQQLSEAFVKSYTQAFCCEKYNHLELAVCGYRNAIEILIKDYAIKYKGVPREKLKRKSLKDCIKDYLDNADEVASAYMVKEFGNDAAHYPPDNELVDFTTFKKFLKYFISTIEGKVMIHEASGSLPKDLKNKLESQSD